MKTYIHIPKDFQTGTREIEIHKDGQVLVLTEQELDQAFKKMQDAPLDEEMRDEDSQEDRENEVNQPDETPEPTSDWELVEDN